MLNRRDDQIHILLQTQFSQFNCILTVLPLFKMSKWNKPGKEPSQEFLQNEERRRQLIVEAAKRRREKQKKLQELNEDIKKKQQQALSKYKQDKREAHTKYLKGNNMHDKYEDKKRRQKLGEETVKDVSKWKRKGKSEEKVWDMEPMNKNQSKPVEGNSKMQKFNSNKSVEQKMNPIKKAMEDQFEKQWGEEVENDEMINSKLLDSLDLDFGTIQRCQNFNMEMKKKDDDRKQKQNDIKNVQDELKEIKQMIGYQSMVCDSMVDLKSQIASRKQKNAIEESANKKNSSKNIKKDANEQQTFNKLKNKKQAKILEWAGTEAEEVDDLFSNCSSKNKINAIPDVVNKISSRKVLEPIPERKSMNRSEEKRGNVNSRSVQKKNDMKKQQKPVSRPNIAPPVLPTIKKQQNRPTSVERRNSIDKKNVNIRQPVVNTQPKSQEKKRSTSQSKNQSQQNFRKIQPDAEKRAPGKTHQSFKAYKSPPIPAPRPTQSVVTHQQFFDIESFIKHDLTNINEEQRKLQQQIRDLHLANKEKVKEVQQKYEIKTNLKNTDNLIRHLHGQFDDMENYSGQSKVFKNEIDIEDSIERLDDLLIRRDLQSRERPLTHITQESHLRESSSIIDPLCRPEDLHKQILQLAENISRFEEEPQENVQGYGFKKRMMKKKDASLQKPIKTQHSQKHEQEGYGRIKASQNKQDLHGPPLLSYSSKQKDEEQNISAFQDSLDTMEKGKIQVNQKLRNLLFD